MKFMKLFMIGVSMIGLHHAHASEFVISKKTPAVTPKSSTNTLKEQLGNQAKDAFHASRSLTKHIGKSTVLLTDLHDKKYAHVTSSSNLGLIHKQKGTLLVCLTRLQKKFSLTLECLLDNKAPFKRASKNDLCAAHGTLKDIATSLVRYKNHIKLCQQTLEKNLKMQTEMTAVSSQEKSDGAPAQVTKKSEVPSLKNILAKLTSTVNEAACSLTQAQEKIMSDPCLKQIA